ncbi:MAG: hypothetical protein ACOY3E_13340 [Pseudomonadota bacterium]
MPDALLPTLHQPWYQAGALLALTVLLFILLRPKQQDSLWLIASLGYALFILVNALASWFSDSGWTYALLSLLTSVLYLAAAAAIVTLFTSLLQAKGAGESAMIFLIIIYHPVALALVKLSQWLYRNWS